MKSDTQIQQDVLNELKWDPSINAAKIGVEVKDGIVTLAGHVCTYSEKWDAERAAQRVSGVKALTVEIDVKLASGNERTDVDIARSAENMLQWMTNVPKESIKVMVEKGWITLSGKVEWEFQRKSAVDLVRNLMGVKGVSSSIAITPSISLGAVQSEIEAALKRQAITDARHVFVAVDGSNVTLSGTVHSWSERELATHSAWGTPGVRNVIDKIVVTS